MFVLLAVILIAVTVFFSVKDNRPGAVTCGILLLVLAIARPFFADTAQDRWARFDGKTKSTLAEVFATKITERHPGKRIALIVAPEMEGLSASRRDKDETGTLLAQALRALGQEPVVKPLSLGAKFEKKLAQMKPSEGLDSSTEMVYFTTLMGVLAQYGAKDINALLRELKDEADVVVFVVNISVPIEASELLARGQGPELVLMKVGVRDVEKGFQSTVLDMHLRYRPDASWEIDYEWPKGDEEAFSHRYTLATRENPRPLAR